MPKAKIVTTNNYKGHPVMNKPNKTYAFNARILDKIDSMFNDMTSKHNKVFFMRMDVRFPQDSNYPQDNSLFSKFITNWNRDRRYNGLDAQTLWVRERSKEKHQHYHCISLMDGNRTQCIQPHIKKAEHIWSTTLKIPESNVQGLIDNCTKTRTGEAQQNGIMLRKDDPDFLKKIDDCRSWSSYLAKGITKGSSNDGIRDFGGAERQRKHE